MATRKAFNEFFNGYVECALWSSNDDRDKPLDANYSKSDIAKDSLREMKRDCVKFMRAEKKDLFDFKLEVGRQWSSLGHDFWLTRNRHGAGFWDRGDGDAGSRLTDAAHDYGSSDLYVGDDGKIHVS